MRQRYFRQVKKSKKMEYHICKSGRYDAVMPLIKDDTIAGFLIMGQVRRVDSPVFPNHLSGIDSDISEKLSHLCKDIQFISKDKLKVLYDLLPDIFLQAI